VDGKGLNTHVLQALGYFLHVERVVVPAEAGFHRHGQVSVFDHGGGHGHHLGDVAQQGRARAAHGHLLYGAAIVDIDKVGAGLGADGRALAHRLHVGAEKLDADGPLVVKHV
jgi:hypothetical protein